MTRISRRAAASGLAAAASGAFLSGRSWAQGATFDIQVGAVLPMSGPNAELGANAEKALRTALELVHGDYDLDLPLARTDHIPNVPGGRLKYLVADHKGDPAVARAEAEKLISSGKAVALIGCADERVSEAVADFADKAGIPFIDADSTSVAARKRPSRFTFRFAADEDARAVSVFDFLDKMREDRKADVKSLALLHDKDPEDVRAAQVLRALATERRVSVVAEAPHTRGRPEQADANAAKLRQQADLVLVMGAAADGAQLVARSSTAAKGAPILLYPSRLTDRAVSVIPEAGRGLMVVNGFARDTRDNDPNIAAINTLYRSFAHRDLDELAALQFTGLLTLAFAINEARGTAPVALAQKLAAARFPGDRTIMPWEQLVFNAAGHNTGAGVVVTQRQTEKSLTVFPPRFASSAAQWKI